MIGGVCADRCTATAPILVLGVGNPHRGDDGAGALVIEALRGRVPAGVELACRQGEPTSLLLAWEGRERLVLIDAAAPAGQPGRVCSFDVAAGSLPAICGSHASGHGLGPAQAVELARVLGRLPPRALLYTIEAAAFETGAPLTPAVEAAARLLADRLLHQLEGEARVLSRFAAAARR